MAEKIKLYHFFRFSRYYGWQNLGNVEGYKTLKELKSELEDYITNPKQKWRIMKLKTLEASK